MSVLAALIGVSRPAGAQDPPPPIPRFVVDLHGTVTNFPDSPVLAASRGLSQAELPGLGLGGAVSAHVYPFKLGAVTFGIGARVSTSRAHSTPDAQTEPTLRPVTERFTYFGPQVSLNFGTGAGWSYLSGGHQSVDLVDRARWREPAAAGRGAAEDDRLRRGRPMVRPSAPGLQLRCPFLRDQSELSDVRAARRTQNDPAGLWRRGLAEIGL